ncbi:37851_t:CDS:2, partial [Gigaspora margarita]
MNPENPEKLQIFCLVLGDTIWQSFPVEIEKKMTVGHLKDLIKKKKDPYYNHISADEFELWKVDIPISLENVDTIIYAEKISEYKGVRLLPNATMEAVFHKGPKNSSIHIIAQPPASNSDTTERQKNLSSSALGPNWNDASSIHSWMQKYPLKRGRNRVLLKPSEKTLSFLRDDTINILWHGDPLTKRNGIVGRFKSRNQKDKSLHPIPVLAGGPGTGKSRFLDEIERLIKQYAHGSDDEEIRNSFANMIIINTTYGNESPADEKDKMIDAQASLAIRILFSYFRPQHLDSGEFDFPAFRSLCKNSTISDVTLSIVLRVVYNDAMQMNQATSSNPLLVIVLGIDEFNKLHDIDKGISKRLIHAIGGMMCASPANIFFIPILAGTIEGPLEQFITGSMHKSLRLPLRLLEDNDVIEIGKAMKLFDNKYVSYHPYFRVSISDIGGHVRTSEYFYQAFTNMMQQRKDIYDVKIDDIMMTVKYTIGADYRLDSYSTWLTEALAKAILGLPVKKGDKIMLDDGFTSYQDLSSMGILNLILIEPTTGKCHIRIPYLWASLLVRSSNHAGMAYWKSMFDYDEPMYWQNFEEFNAKFWALRLSLFYLLGYKTIKLEELLKGAKFSRHFPEVEVVLHQNVKLCQLRHRYPVSDATTNKDKTVKNDDHTEVRHGYIFIDYLMNDDIEKYIGYVFLNAVGAPWDVFGFLNMTYHTNDGRSESGILCVVQQEKLTNIEAIKSIIIDQDLFDEEHKKVSEAMKHVPTKNWALLFLTNADTKNALSIKCKPNSALVSREQFQEFYGYTYASRAQFASANEIIYINMAPAESLKILGFTESERDIICLKRKESPLRNLDDLKNKIGMNDKRFKKL